MVNELATPLALSLAVALVLSGCTGDSNTAPSPSPATSSPAASTSTSETVSPSPSPTASPTPTPSPTPTSEPPSPTPSPTPTAAVGIDPPTEAPSEFGEFAVPSPDQLTEEYAAWVLASLYAAEDSIVQTAVEEPDTDAGELPPLIQQAVEETYADPLREGVVQVYVDTVALSEADDAFAERPGSTRIRNIELVDATQECLIVRMVQDSSPVLQEPIEPRQMIVQLTPKPVVDGSETNRTPWLMANRAPVEDVTGSTCT